MPPDRRRQIPKVDKLLESESVRELIETYSRRHVLAAIRGALERVRGTIASGNDESFSFSEEDFFEEVREGLERYGRQGLRRVINATGIVLHTNLGRAPLALDALSAVAETALGYSNLEYDLESGERGSRYSHVAGLLCELTGAESALVVNNNAAAVTLVVDTLAKDGEVVVSRGELIEIGGSFRIHEVISRSGARLVEVGATNRTRIADYEGAIGDETRVLMKVHPSNYRIVGFSGEAAREEVVALGKEYGIAVVEDLGSGTLVDLRSYGLPHEVTVPEVVAAGVDVVTFSGDKLLGGPQAGIILGKADLTGRMKENPLLRAFRIDKLSLAALEATLRLYLDEDTLAASLPLLRLLTQDVQTLSRRASRLRRVLSKLDGLEVRVEDGEGFSGGGSLPGKGIPTKLVAVQCGRMNPDEIAAALRRQATPVVGRISKQSFVLDMRTVADGEVPEIGEAFERAFR